MWLLLVCAVAWSVVAFCFVLLLVLLLLASLASTVFSLLVEGVPLLAVSWLLLFPCADRAGLFAGTGPLVPLPLLLLLLLLVSVLAVLALVWWSTDLM
jgi:hypothetical protein